MDRTVDGQAREVEYVLVHTTYDDGVHLDRREAVFERGIDTGERLFDAAEARDLGKPCGVERVERDVDAIQACCAQVGRHARQQGTVGGEGDVLDPGNRADFLDEWHDAMRDERFAAGEADTRDALLRHDAHEAGDLLGGEQLAVGARGHARLGHAVHAAEVAFIRHGDAQVVDAAAKAVV